jgi:hypothetical protein
MNAIQSPKKGRSGAEQVAEKGLNLIFLREMKFYRG